MTPTGLTPERIAGIRKGQRYVAKAELELTCLLYWNAPFSAGCPVTFPRGEVLVVRTDAVLPASAVSCLPERYDELLAVLLKDVLHEGFVSYSLSVPFGVLLNDCELLEGKAACRE